MIPLRNIGVRSARIVKKEGKLVKHDIHKSSFKRNVNEMLETIGKNIDKVGINIDDHIHQVLGKSSIGTSSSLFLHLDFKATVQAANKLRTVPDHAYSNLNSSAHCNINPISSRHHWYSSK